jgi:ABC-type sugar transport system ATPase subunit
MISSEMPEVVGMCNRIIVLYEGEQTGELVGGNVTQEQIMELASNITESTKAS